VHGGDHEVAGLGGADRHLDRLEVAQLADDDDVGILAQGAFERGGEGLGVGADLALGDVAADGGLHDLDGVLDRDDVVLAFLVQLGDERGEGGGLARADRAGDEDEAVVVGEQFADRLEVAQAEVVELGDRGRDHAVGAGGAVFVKHQIHPVAVGGVEGQGEVQVLAVEEQLALMGGEEGGIEAQGLLGAQGLVVDAFDGALFADEGAGSGGEVEVADALAGADLQQVAQGGVQFGVGERAHPGEGKIVDAAGRRDGGGGDEGRGGGDRVRRGRVGGVKSRTGARRIGFGWTRPTGQRRRSARAPGRERIIEGRPHPPLGLGETGDAFEDLDFFLGDEAGIHKVLRVTEQIDVFAQL